MKVYRIRSALQIISFLVFIYGVYLGFNLTNFLPVALCTNPSNYSAGCYLLPWQNMQFGLVEYPPRSNITVKAGLLAFPQYLQMWGKAKTYFLFFFSLFVFFILFNKLWCGWMCPFGTFQDVLSFFRKKLRIRETSFSQKTKEILMSAKYISLFLFMFFIIFALFGGSPYHTVLFCRICPARPFLSLFQGNVANFGIGRPPGIIESAITCFLAGFLLVGMFLKSRVFCFFCPTSGMINIVNRLSLVKLKKNTCSCNNCGHCRRVCPMDIKEICEEKEKEDILTPDCILCLKCIESCPQDNTLMLKAFKKSIFSSSKEYFIKLFVK